ncbi:MAG: hypothetical protein SGJ23_06285 [Alphaproteobacteria bacterium]|nr:hypothetical protein [Alphaproteobacteria bacterium]
MDLLASLLFTLACLAGAVFFLGSAMKDWRTRPPPKPRQPRHAPSTMPRNAPPPVAPAPYEEDIAAGLAPRPVRPSLPVRSVHPNGAGGSLARALGWAIGLTVMLGTLALVVVAVTGDTKDAAKQAAAEKPRRVCPPVVSIPPRSIGYPADDVMGVRSGMTWRDAEETLKCVSEDYVIQRVTHTSTVTGKGKQSRIVMRATRGPETISVAFFGVAGQERAAAMWQEKYYDVGAGPARQQIEGELVAHYGTPHEDRDPTTNERSLRWNFAPDGRPLRKRPKDGSAGYFLDMASYMAAGFTVAACAKNAQLDPAKAPSWDGRCGLTIFAEIDATMASPTRASRFRVVVLDQQALARYAAPLRAVAAPDKAK